MKVVLIFLFNAFGADVWGGVSGFCRSPEDPENPIYLQTGRESGGVHDES